MDAALLKHVYDLSQTTMQLAKEQVITNKLKALELSLTHGNAKYMAPAEVQTEIDKIMNRH